MDMEHRFVPMCTCREVCSTPTLNVRDAERNVEVKSSYMGFGNFDCRGYIAPRHKHSFGLSDDQKSDVLTQAAWLSCDWRRMVAECNVGWNPRVAKPFHLGNKVQTVLQSPLAVKEIPAITKNVAALSIAKSTSFPSLRVAVESQTRCAVTRRATAMGCPSEYRCVYERNAMCLRRLPHNG